ncbi:MAG: hypothetical protein QNJ43_11115 [Breoghania sp.]|nr:hypothetical protein [Breoghania sp.]
MAGIRAANAHQEIVFQRDVAHDVPLAFASELPADQNIDQSIVQSRIEIEGCGGPNEDGFLAAPVRQNDNVGDFSELFDLALSPIALQLIVGNRFIVFPAACFVPLAQFLVGGG